MSKNLFNFSYVAKHFYKFVMILNNICRKFDLISHSKYTVVIQQRFFRSVQHKTSNTTITMRHSNANTANNINSAGVNNGIYANDGSKPVAPTPSNAVVNM